MYWSSQDLRDAAGRVFLPTERSPHSSPAVSLCVPAALGELSRPYIGRPSKGDLPVPPALSGLTIGDTIGGVLLEERDSRGWVLKALREAGGSLVSEFYRVDDTQLRECLNEDDWCLAEIAGHIRDWEELAFLQIGAILDNERRLPTWDLEVLPRERDYRSADVEDFLMEFRGLRQDTAGMLWGLRDHEWRREGQHPYRGAVTVEQLARELAQHDLEQLWRVRRIKDALGVEVRVRGDDWM